jgi:hypothetical protein
MGKKIRKIFENSIQFLVWLTGVIVSLAVGFGMVDKVLSVRFIPLEITFIFGWIVIVTTLLGVLFAVLRLLK